MAYGGAGAAAADSASGASGSKGAGHTVTMVTVAQVVRPGDVWATPDHTQGVRPCCGELMRARGCLCCLGEPLNFCWVASVCSIPI